MHLYPTQGISTMEMEIGGYLQQSAQITDEECETEESDLTPPR